MSFTNDISLASNGPSSTLSFPANGATVSFTITITNPCFATTIPELVFSPVDLMTLTDGTTGTQAFVRPINTVEASTGVGLICGPYVFEVYQDVSDTALSSAWITIAE